MSFEFPRVSGRTLGYEPGEVDEFVERARLAYAEPGTTLVDAARLRSQGFKLVRNGYSVSAVDGALDRLEDVFVEREFAARVANFGDSAMASEIIRLQNLVLGRAQRPRGSKFKRVVWPLRGYNVRAVNRLCKKVVDHVSAAKPLEISEVRRAIFVQSRRGYNESQVDAFIDRVLELLESERALGR
ncbi:MAG: hypothetical protein RLZZ626_427 [Actinomycetota bacterium]